MNERIWNDVSTFILCAGQRKHVRVERRFPVPPDDVQYSDNFGLQRTEQFLAELVEEPGQQDEEPVVQVRLVQHDEVTQHVQEQTVHLQKGVTRHTSRIQTSVPTCYFTGITSQYFVAKVRVRVDTDEQTSIYTKVGRHLV